MKELQRLLGKKTMESEILKEALEIAGGPKNGCCARSLFQGGFWNEDRLRNYGCRPLEYRRACRRVPFQIQRTPTTPGSGAGGRNQSHHSDMPTYGYRRVHAILRRNAQNDGRSWPQRQARLPGHEAAQPVIGASIPERPMIASTMVSSLSNIRTSGGAPMTSRSAATTRRRSASASPSTAATVRLSPMSPPPRAARAKTCRTS